MADATLSQRLRSWPSSDMTTLRALLDEAADALEPRPIESAPKDGTEVDLWTPSGRVANCRWGKPAAANWGDRYGDDRNLPEDWMTRAGHALDRRNGEPTHWSPIPKHAERRS